MLIKLHDSRLFTIDPAIRFAETYGVKRKVWNEIWKRYLSGYDYDALIGYFLYKTHKPIAPRAMRDWIVKTEIYCRANHVILMGVRVVHSEYFGEYEDYLLKDAIENMKYKGTKDSQIIV